MSTLQNEFPAILCLLKLKDDFILHDKEDLILQFVSEKNIDEEFGFMELKESIDIPSKNLALRTRTFSNLLEFFRNYIVRRYDLRKINQIISNLSGLKENTWDRYIDNVVLSLTSSNISMLDKGNYQILLYLEDCTYAEEEICNRLKKIMKLL